MRLTNKIKNELITQLIKTAFTAQYAQLDAAITEELDRIVTERFHANNAKALAANLPKEYFNIRSTFTVHPADYKTTTMDSFTNNAGIITPPVKGVNGALTRIKNIFAPACFIKHDNHYSMASNHSEYLTVTTSKPLVCPIHQGNYIAEVVNDGDELVELLVKLNQLHNDIVVFNDKLLQIITPCSTSNKLIDVLPEVEPFLPVEATMQLPAINKSIAASVANTITTAMLQNAKLKQGKV